MNRRMVTAEWHRAARCLDEAGLLMREGYCEGSVSRAYYAILHAAKSALHVHNVEASSHSGVRRMFGLHLVRTGEIERKWASDLAEGLDDRLMVDYSPNIRFSSEEARDEYERATAFLERIRQYLASKGLTEEELAAERGVG